MLTLDTPAPPRALSVALAGNPNAGKSTLFNALTGARQHVGNWPGKTVEKKSGECGRGDLRLKITDLPGAYSLSAYSLEEVVTRDYLLDGDPDVIVVVVDAANLERNLYLVVQLLELNRPTVVVLNMMDVVERQGLRIDVAALSRALGAPVVPATARREDGLDDVVAAVAAAAGGADASEFPFELDYGPALEEEIGYLTTEIAAYPALVAAYAPRWLALRLLEGDDDIAARLDGLPGGAAVQAAAAACAARVRPLLPEDVDVVIADRRYSWIHDLTARVATSDRPASATLSDRIDSVATNRYLGIPIFLLAMWLVFKITTELSAPWVDWLDGVLSGPISRWALAGLGAVELGETWVASLVVDGVIAGVGSVLAFVPVLLALYFALAVLEDSGYMARGAFVMDRLMNRIGLHGRSFLPLMVGFGCSVPAIYATRTMTNRRDRVLTGLLVPFMSCGARLPVYVLFAAIFFPGYAGLIILGLYLLGIVVAIGVGFLLQRTLLPAEGAPGLVMELPPYRLPNARSIRYHMWLRTRSFLQHASSLILATTLVIWLLTAIPVGGDGGSFADTPMPDSAFGRLSSLAVPVLRPLGFGSWQAGGALITGLVAKEVVVSTMGQTFDVAEADAGAEGRTFMEDVAEIVTSFGQAVVDTLRAIPGLIGINLGGDEDATPPALSTAIRDSFTASSNGHAAAAGLAFMVFVLLYTPCMAAVAAERHELGMRWTWLSLGGQLALAWLLAFVVFRLGVGLAAALGGG